MQTSKDELLPFELTKVDGRETYEGETLFLITNPSVEWRSSAGADRYTIRVVRESDKLAVCTKTSKSEAVDLATCSLDEGVTYRIVVLAHSASGKTVESSTQPYIMIDLHDPTVQIVSQPPASSSSAQGTFTFSSSDVGSGVDRTECKIDTAPYAPCTSPMTTAALSVGSHQFSIRSYDKAGRTSAIAQYSWVIDPTQPSSFGVLGVRGGTDTLEDICLTNGVTPTIAWQASASADSYDVSVLASDGVTVVCPAQNTTLLQLSLAGCSLSANTAYKVKLIAKRNTGSFIEGSNSPYSFTVNSSAATTQSSIVGSSPVVANGVATSAVLITLRNAQGCALESVAPTFSATNTNSTNAYGTCSATSSSGASNCTLSSTKAENKTLSLTTPISLSGGSVLFVAGAANKLAFQTQPSSTAIAGQVLAQAPVVSVMDAFDNLVTSPAVDITTEVFSDNTCTTPAVGVLGITTNPVQTTAGLATIAGLSFTKAGPIYFRASSAPLTNKCSSLVTITHDVASALAFDQLPSSYIKYNVVFPTQPQVSIRDQFANLVTTGPDATATITLTLQTGTGTLNGTTSMNSVGGIANFTGKGLNISQWGTKVLRATKASTIPMSGTGILTADSSGFEVAAIACNTGDLISSCIISTTQTIPNGAVIKSTGNFRIENNTVLQNLTPMESISFDIAGDFDIGTSAGVNANVSELKANRLRLLGYASFISADALGYRGGRNSGNLSLNGEGPGGGTYAAPDGSGHSCGGGGGHGGAGGTCNRAGGTGGSQNGSQSAPSAFGSGGAAGNAINANGGNGGGYIKIVVNELIGTDYSEIKALGQTAGAYLDSVGGGGSGGTIVIQANTFSTVSTFLFAWGGNGAWETVYGGGGGSGGRIVIVAPTLPAMTYSTYAGLGHPSQADAGRGTYFHDLSAVNICDVGTLSTTCQINRSKMFPPSFAITGTGNLLVNPGGRIACSQVLDTLTIDMGGNITLQGYNAGLSCNFPLIKANNFYAYGYTYIVASGLGHPGGRSAGNSSPNGAGPGGGIGSIATQSGGGGGYGGTGGNGTGGATGGVAVGSASTFSDFGSGGGAGYKWSDSGGSGGGYVNIEITNSFLSEASIEVRGGNVGYDAYYAGSGAGSGGAFRIKAKDFHGSGYVSVSGGSSGKHQSSAAYGGSGGGGRIWVEGEKYFGNSISYWAGMDYNSNAYKGQPGSYHFSQIGTNPLCDTGDVSTTCTLLKNKFVVNGATINVAGNLTLENQTKLFNSIQMQTWTLNVGGHTQLKYGALLQGNLTFNSNTLKIDGGAAILADSLGYFGGRQGDNSLPNGMGAGGGTGSSILNGALSDVKGGSGGGYGGAGLASSDFAGGVAYGSSAVPNDFGSGGGASHFYSPGGTGGGRLIINVTGLMENQGDIVARGESVNAGYYGPAGAGAGGSIRVSAGSFSNDRGNIWAHGGSTYSDSVNHNGYFPLGAKGGAGGGGRVAITAPSAYPGPILVTGGISPWLSLSAANGTINYDTNYLSDALCDSGSLNTTCVITKSKWLPSGTTISGAGNLSIQYPGSIFSPHNLASLTLNFGGNVVVGNSAAITGNVAITAANVTVDGSIDANGLGYQGGSNLGNPLFSGAGGTQGGTRAIGASADSVSAGGGGHGGAGGMGADAAALGGG
ncbi:MAG: Ig-like domain-containing protein, partial [Bdellovibrionales bacterium]|nr:Ig-like domain-containing protein [Bdellovibrionales bacterium]